MPFSSLPRAASTPVEQQLLTHFFRAARVRDNTTLASMSAVSFDPRTDGTVQDFKIDSIGAQQHRKLQVQEFTEEQDKIRADQVEFTKKMRDFYQSNSIAIDRAMKADQAKQPVNGKDAALLAEWKKWDTDSRDLERKLSQARQKVAKERSSAACQPDSARSRRRRRDRHGRRHHQRARYRHRAGANARREDDADDDGGHASAGVGQEGRPDARRTLDHHVDPAAGRLDPTVVGAM